jgi:hypothetical protein
MRRRRYDAAMRTTGLIPALLVVLVAACGSSGGSSPGSSAIGSPPVTGQPAVTAEPAGNGKIDCAKVKTAATNLLMIQFLAQLRTPDSVEQIKTKQYGSLDLEVFLAAMHDLHALDASASPLGDPKAAIDFYEDAGKAAQALFATEPMTQAAIDAYTQKIGTIPEFLSHQAAIAGAMDAAGC